MAAHGEHAVLTGLTVKVFEISSEQKNAVNIGEICAAKTAEPVLTPADPSGTTTFTVSASSSAHETNKYYAIQIEYNGDNLGEGNDLTARLTIHQGFSA